MISTNLQQLDKRERTEKLRDGWRIMRFGEAASNVDITEHNPLANGIERYVGLDHIDPESLHLKRWGLIEEGTSFTRKFVKGQVLFGKRRAYQRKVAIADFDGICSGDILVFEAKNDLLPELLPFIVQSEGFYEYALSTSAGSLSPRTKWKDLAAYEFALPPKDEQRRIADILWAAEDLLSKLDNLSEEDRQLQNTIMQSLFSNGLPGWHNAYKSSKFGNIPTDWQIQPISEIAEVAYGISEAVASNTDPSIGWPILTGANITLNGTIDLFKLNYIAEPKKESFILKKGDLLLNWRSGSPEHVGKTAIFDLNGTFTYASFILRIRVGEKINNIFLHRLLNFMRRNKLFVGSTSQQVNFKMNAAMFRDVLVIVPPVGEQLEIVKKCLSLEYG